MSDGKTHDRVGVLIGLAAGVSLGTGYDPILGVLLGGSCVAGTLLLSPDLDVKGSFKCRSWHRWKKMGLHWYWDLYAHAIPHHRHWLSHSPVLSTALRLIVCGWPLLWFGLEPTHLQEYLAIYLGFELATCIHLKLDGLL